MRRSKRATTSEELHLLPVMNLISVLIPFLLMGAQFVTLAVLDATLPALEANSPPPEGPLLNLWVFISREGYVISGADPMLHPDGKDSVVIPCAVEGCPNPEAYARAELTRLLSYVKDEWPEEQTAVIAPDESVPYDVMIATMDALRADESTRVGETARTLFPDIVIASDPGIATPAGGGG